MLQVKTCHVFKNYQFQFGCLSRVAVCKQYKSNKPRAVNDWHECLLHAQGTLCSIHCILSTVETAGFINLYTVLYGGKHDTLPEKKILIRVCCS